MSGAEARAGFRFQDLYLLNRVLLSIAELNQALIDASPPPPPLNFGIESHLGSHRRQTAWDVLVIGDGVHVELIEAKSGVVTQQDRKAFWLRLRCELTVAERSDILIPTLVVNCDRLPSAIGPWRQLHAAALSRDQNIVVPDRPPSRVTNVKDLLAEALHYLCHERYAHTGQWEQPEHGNDCNQPSTAAALATLRRVRLVEISKHSLVRHIHEALSVAAHVPDPAVLRRQLEGWLNEQATLPTGVSRRFTLEDMLAEVYVLRQLVERTPASIHLAQALQQRMSPACVQGWAQAGATAEGLQEVALEETQPQLSAISRDNLVKSIALIGDGGQGKSYLLYQLYRQLSAADRLDVVAAAAEDLAEYINDHQQSSGTLRDALQLLADVSTLRGRHMVLLVDGLDQVLEAARCALLKLMADNSDTTGLRCIVSCRRPDWNAQQRLSELARSWNVIELADWPTEVIRRELQRHGLVRQIAPGIQQLLGSPLYLELLLRTFGRKDTFPAELQTRHGLIKAFWEGRVLSDNQTTRWGILRQGCETLACGLRWLPAVASGSPEWQAVEHLVSIGLLVRVNARGRLDFRHPLLRDFALGQWAMASATTDEVWAKTQNITSPTLRYGAARAVVEAACERAGSRYAADFGLMEYLYAMPKPEAVVEVGDILGGLVPTMDMDPAKWSPAFGVEIVKRLIRSSRYHLNWHWGPVYSSWPQALGWAEQQDWLDLTTLRELLEYLTLAEDTHRTATGITLEWISTLAERLREWSRCLFCRAAGSYVTEFFDDLMPVICRWAPDTATLHWLEDVAAQRMSGPGILSALRSLTPALVEHDLSVVQRVTTLYRHVLGIQHNVSWTIDEDEWSLGQEVLWSLTGTNTTNSGWPKLAMPGDHNQPLLDAYPEAFVPVTIDLITALVVRYWDMGNPPGNGLIIDYCPSPPFGCHAQLEYFLLDELYHRMTHWLMERPDWFMATVYPKVKGCRVGTVQAALMALADEADPHGCLASMVRGLMVHEELYHVNTAARPLLRLMARDWHTFAATDRQRIIDIVQRLLDNADTQSDHFVTLLQDCIDDNLDVPLSDLPSELVELLCQPGQTATVFSTRPNAAMTADSPQSCAASLEWVPPVDTAEMALLRTACDSLNYTSNHTATHVTEAVDVAQMVLPALRESVPQILIQPWPLNSLTHLLVAHMEVSRRVSVVPLSTLADEITELAVSVLERAPVPGVAVDFSVNRDFSAATPDDTWSQSLFLANVALCHPDAQNPTKFADRLTSIAHRALAESSPFAHQLLFSQLHPDFWLRLDTPHRNDLKDLALCVITHPACQFAALQMINRLSDHIMADAFLRVMLSTSHAQEQVSYNLGKIIGIRALFTTRMGKRLPAREMLDQLTRDPQQFPLLQQPIARQEFVWGLLFGLKTQATFCQEDAGVISDYVRWLAQLWDEVQLTGPLEIAAPSPLATLPLPGPSEFTNWALHGMPSFMALALQGLFKSKNVDHQRFQWETFLPLARRVAQSGSQSELISLLKDLKQAPNLSDSYLFDVLDLIVNRIIAGHPSQQGAEWTTSWQWFEIAEHAAEALYRVCRKAAQNHAELDKGYAMLTHLAAAPFDLATAHQLLINLRTELEQG